MDHNILEENASRCPNQESCDKPVIDLNLVESSLRSDPFLTCKKLKTMILEKTWYVRFKGACENVHRQTDIHSQKGKVLWIGKNALNLNR
jgi:hypothetical protein